MVVYGGMWAWPSNDTVPIDGFAASVTWSVFGSIWRVATPLRPKLSVAVSLISNEVPSPWSGTVN